MDGNENQQNIPNNSNWKCIRGSVRWADLSLSDTSNSWLPSQTEVRNDSKSCGLTSLLYKSTILGDSTANHPKYTEGQPGTLKATSFSGIAPKLLTSKVINKTMTSSSTTEEFSKIPKDLLEVCEVHEENNSLSLHFGDINNDQSNNCDTFDPRSLIQTANLQTPKILGTIKSSLSNISEKINISQTIPNTNNDNQNDTNKDGICNFNNIIDDLDLELSDPNNTNELSSNLDSKLRQNNKRGISKDNVASPIIGSHEILKRQRYSSNKICNSGTDNGTLNLIYTERMSSPSSVTSFRGSRSARGINSTPRRCSISSNISSNKSPITPKDQQYKRNFTYSHSQHSTENSNNVTQSNTATVDWNKRISSRLFQIAVGKGTRAYQNYLKLKPNKDSRDPQDPQTPNAHSRCPQKQFTEQLNIWRKSLHQYDDTENE
ncbi:hypothetical protein cand_006850 [Cryptosporidium andersoni]|uniref:Histone RNA hairpin-binding protein RNA-binding domain-containing protein n=1 Tax=Cryptosporidium andersoni TaxID=117008 RepID=A0A1J4MPJ0_9CRYT|nr:hypothetical protein cand_006850 [Cryptosporidium andersoni]